MTERQKKYYQENKDVIDARTNKWRHDNPEKVKAIQLRNKQTFREKMDAEYPGGYKAYKAEEMRRYRARKKADALTAD